MNNVVKLPEWDASDVETASGEDHHAGATVGERTRPLSRRGPFLLGLIVLALLGGGLVYGYWRNEMETAQVLASAEKRRNFVPTLEVSKVKASEPTITTNLPATALAYTTANIYARVSGYIQQRNVDIGDSVKGGDVLVEISAPEIEHQLAQAEATLAQTKATHRQLIANRELAKVTKRRNAPLVNKGYVSALTGDTNKYSLDAQEADVKAAEANIAAQNAAVGVARQQMKYQKVLAPFDGVITKRNVNIGDLVQADATSGTFLFTIMESDVIRTQVYVPQDQAFGLAPGTPAVVRVAQLPGKTFSGTVTRIADALQPGTRTLLAEIDIENPEGLMSPGMYCMVELEIPRETPSLLIPAETVIFDENGMQVAVVKNGVVHIQKVTVARDLGTTIEVRAGVNVGDELIRNPPVTIADGDKVKVKLFNPDKKP